MSSVWFVFGTMALFLLMNIPVAFALGLTAMFFLMFKTTVPLSIIVQRLYLGADSFPLLAAPLFILAGNLMNESGMSDRLVDFASAIVGHIQGGLAAVNVLTSMLFAGISGSSMADTAAVGGVLIPAMIERGYPRDFTAAVTAASSTIGIIIPPSVPMILYGVFMQVSVTTLFIAGIIPGILVGLAQIAVAYIICVRSGYEPPTTFSWRTLLQSTIDALPVLVLPLIILGGIMGGVFTPTEAAAVAVVYAFLLGALVYKAFDAKRLFKILLTSAETTGSVMIVIAVASLLGWILAYARIPQLLVGPFLNMTSNPTAFMWVASVILIIAGTFLHGTAMLVIIVPLLGAVAKAMAIDPIQFGMVVILNWGIGQQTPPVGSALFITCSLAKVDMAELTRANIPFIGTLLLVLALVIHFPSIVLFVPRLVGIYG
ncbi:MAG: TRAP transporter large permease [Firmicutes bacterium]|nr:TRAP transporter large permease [Bacillota bacterium]